MRVTHEWKRKRINICHTKKESIYSKDLINRMALNLSTNLDTEKKKDVILHICTPSQCNQ